MLCVEEKGQKSYQNHRHCTEFIKQSREIKYNNIVPTVHRQYVYTNRPTNASPIYN